MFICNASISDVHNDGISCQAVFEFLISEIYFCLIKPSVRSVHVNVPILHLLRSAHMLQNVHNVVMFPGHAIFLPLLKSDRPLTF
jgi:hypothetical protein